MKLHQYGKLKRGVFYFQRRIPADVRHAMPFSKMPSVYETSLRTSDVAEAHRLIAERHEWFERHLAAVRAGAPFEDFPPIRPNATKPRRFDEQTAACLAREEFEGLVGITRELRKAAHSGTAEHVERYQEWCDFSLADLNTSIERLRDGDTKPVHRRALRILAEAQFIPPLKPIRSWRDWKEKHPIESTPMFGMLCDALAIASIEAYDAIHMPGAGLLPYEIRSPLLRDAPASLDEGNKFDLRAIADQLIAATPKATKTWHQRLLRAVSISEEFGVPRDIRRVKKDHLAELVEKLQRCPRNSAQRFPGKTWLEAIAANETVKLPTLKPTNVHNSYYAPLKRLFSYAEQKGLIAASPARRIVVAGKRSRGGGGTHFELHELNAMLKLPRFVGCASKSNTLVAGDVLLDDHWFWAPLIALFTGARTGEIAQLLVTEVVFEGSTPYFRFQRDDDRSLKTDASTRTTPIHPMLVEIGFKEYVARVIARGEARVFPDWVKPPFKIHEKGYGDSPSQRNFKRNIVGAISNRTTPRPNFHSFRNTLKTQMFRYRVPTQHQDAMVGHELEGMSRIYTTAIDIDSLGASMASVLFEGLEIDHLYGTRRSVRKQR